MCYSDVAEATMKDVLSSIDRRRWTAVDSRRMSDMDGPGDGVDAHNWSGGMRSVVAVAIEYATKERAE